MKNNFEHILFKIEDGIATITINRPQVYNALGKAGKFELIEAFQSADKDPSIKAIILTGEGRAFSTGQDLNDRSIKSTSVAVDLGNTLETEWNPLVDSIRNCSKIVIGAINGVCAGAGVSVALACDLIISHPKANYISGFSKIGLAPDAGSSFTFTQALGKAKTLEFFLFNKPLSSDDMLKYGLINEVSEQVFERALEMAKQLVLMAPLSTREIKKNVIAAQDSSFRETLELEISAQRKLGSSKDYQEGVQAFLEKRKPTFKGE